MKALSTRSRTIIVAATLLLFAVLFALESIGNHCCFRTYGLDLGLYTKTLYDHAHLRPNDCSFFLDTPSNQMGDHFDIYLWLFSPLVYLFGNYTLLIIQIASVIVGMYGTYRLVRLYTDDNVLPFAAMLTIGFSFGVWHALSFDYHSNVVSAMMLPWLFYFFKKGSVGGMVTMALFMSIAKETSALWVCFVLAALLWDCRREKRMLLAVALTLTGCVAYFLIVTLVVMPALGSGGGTGFWRYSWMGDNVGQVAIWMFTHPWQAIKAVFTDFVGTAPGLKTEFFLSILLSGGLLCLFKPNWLLMFVPPLFMKMLARDPCAFWGIALHYNIEACVVAALVMVPVLSRFKAPALRRVAASLVVVASLLTLHHTVTKPRTFVQLDNICIFSADHYRQPTFDASAARRMIGEIPSDASVCASTMLSPHLAMRDSVYSFPTGISKANYFLLLQNHFCYTDNDEQIAHEIINDTVQYRVVDSGDNIYLLVTIR